MIRATLVRLVRAAFHGLGLDIERRNRNPEVTWLGLRHVAFREVLDVGANRGQFLRRAIQSFPLARIHCFEPLPGVFSELEMAAQTFEGRDIRCLNVAAGSASGIAVLHVPRRHDAASSLLTPGTELESLYPIALPTEEVRVRVEPLDLLLKLPLQRPSFLKLDVQGSELEVLKGARQVLRETDAAQIEVNVRAIYAQQPTFRQIVDYLDEFNLRFAGLMGQWYRSDGATTFVDALFVKPSLLNARQAGPANGLN